MTSSSLAPCRCKQGTSSHSPHTHSHKHTHLRTHKHTHTCTHRHSHYVHTLQVQAGHHQSSSSSPPPLPSSVSSTRLDGTGGSTQCWWYAREHLGPSHRMMSLNCSNTNTIRQYLYYFSCAHARWASVIELQQHKHSQTVLILIFMRACTVSTWGRYTGGCHYIAAALCMCIYVRLAVTVDEHRRCLCIWRVPCQTYRIYTLYM